jgi:hypothetical protein
MSRTKKILAISAIALGVIGGAAGPALASASPDGHYTPVSPDGHYTP